MQTLIILVQNVDLLRGQPLIITIDGTSKDVALAGSEKTTRTDNSTIRSESAPAFWTWFVENPRPTPRSQLSQT
jgi:hypothetical protein